jgi:ribosome-associated toxin RatA of RatAB toxin-antitoxin module
VLSRTPTEIVATIGVRQGGLHGEFTTRNTLETDRRIHLQLVNGPFRTLEGEWRLTPIELDGCRVELTMRFAFSNRLTGLLFEPKFAATIGSLVDAFVARARSLP